MTYLKLLFSTLLIFFCLSEGHAQSKDYIETNGERDGQNGVSSFTVKAPKEIFQDEPFKAVFILKASHWKNGKPREGNGMSLMEVKYNKTKNEDRLTTLVTYATYVCSQTGKVKIPPMGIYVDGEEVLSDELEVEVKANPTYGEELSCAQEWLMRCGLPKESICLALKNGEKDFMLFSDMQHKSSVIVATKDLWSKVGQPVLAYSIGNLIASYTESPQGYTNMVTHFRKQLANLKAGKGISNAPLPYQPQHESVRELLGNLQWGQGAPYNQATFMRNNSTPWVGCTPLATAMIMSYYQWPSTAMKWGNLKKAYAEKDKKATNLSELLLEIGLAIDADFRKDATASAMENVKVALCGQYNYSGKMSMRGNLKDTEVAAILYRELDNGRPCIVSYGDHAFVCDGYNGEFFHFIMGWDGFFNGYYRLKIDGLSDKENPRTTMFLKKIIYGIEPLRQEVNREVTPTSAGTLGTMLSASEQATTTRLKITGPLNSSDIRLLRKMAGATDDDPMSWQGGALTELDMAEASIVSDQNPFLTERGNGKWTQMKQVGEEQTTKVYQLDKMDDDTWNDFVESTKDSKIGVTYTRDEKQQCWAHYYCQADTIGINMFSNCSSLKEVILPNNVKKVDGNAFLNCKLLKR